MANDIDKTSPHYKGDFGSIYEVNKKFPTGGVAGDFVVIEGWAHYWNADRATWCVNAERDSYWDELITNIIEKFKLVRGATYMGVASLDTVPTKVIGAKMYYFATVAGTYKNFGDLVVPQGINVFYSENGSSWVNTTLLEVAQELGVSTKKVVSQKALNDALNLKANQSSVNEALAKKFDKESIAQETGEAEDKVMSQKAVTDKLYTEVYTPIEKETENKCYYSPSGKFVSNDIHFRIDYYPVNAGDKVKVNFVSAAPVAGVAFVAEKGQQNAISFSDVGDISATINVSKVVIVPDGANYIAISSKSADESSACNNFKYSINELILTKAEKQEVTAELDKKFDKESIAQETGEAEDKVMSQKAVTDKLYTEVNTPITKEVENYCYYSPSGKFVSNDIHFNVAYYPVKAGDKIKVDFTVNYPIAGLVFVSEKRQQTPISFSDVGQSGASLNVNKIISIPDGVNYIGISYHAGETTSAYKNKNVSRLDSLEEKINNLESIYVSRYKGKKLLAIGDSITAQNYWQKRVGELLGMSVRNHCKGGIGILQMVDGDGSNDAPSGYDPDNFGIDKIYKLNTKDVENVDVIIIMGFYNDRRLATSTPGIKTDMYPTNDTFIGRLNYAIKRIYEELQKASNTNCRVIVCSPHKYGKYPYIDKTANEDGEDIYNAIKVSTDYNSVPCIDLMHNGGINQYNWNLCQKSNSAINSNYIPADGINDGTNKPFNSQTDFPPASENKGKKVTLKEYNGTFTSDGEKWNFDWEPYPWLGDHLHLSQFGGYMLGDYIAAQLLTL